MRTQRPQNKTKQTGLTNKMEKTKFFSVAKRIEKHYFFIIINDI